MAKPASPYRLYGRQIGHGGLRQTQKERMDRMLAQIGVADTGGALDISALCGRDAPTWLEIGFGAGEHLLWQADQNPGVDILGVEPFMTGVSSCLYGVETQALGNVRVCMGDGRVLLSRLPNASIERVFILHPDPWPKWRHAKRRLIQAAFLDDLARVMTPGAELRLGTDWPDYSCWALRQLLAHDAFEWQARGCKDWQDRPGNWPITRYAKKAAQQSRQDVHLSFVRA